MDRIRGITFFFLNGRLVGIYAHCLEESCALDAFDTLFLHYRCRSFVTWIYLPISRHDRVLALGIQAVSPSHGWRSDRNVSVHVRTALAGDISIGLVCTHAPRPISYLAASAPIKMVYGESRSERALRFFGAYTSKSTSDRALPEQFCLKSLGRSPFGKDAIFSWAPLDSVSSTQLFYD